MSGLQGKNVLVTGATKGIGQAIVVKFAQEGANVGINYRSKPEDVQQTERMVQQLCLKCQTAGVKDVPVKGDVSNEEHVKSMFNEMKLQLGGTDILINNAGIQIPEDSHNVESDDFQKVLDVNIKGAYLCAREAINHFLDQLKPGVIINISSVHQVIPKPRFLSYSISKGGLGNITRTLALEYADKGIRVNAVAPGATITPINRAWVDDPAKRAEVESHIPMGRAAEADEVAAVVAFMASDEAAYITGQTLYIDGGLTLYPDFRTAWSSE